MNTKQFILAISGTVVITGLSIYSSLNSTYAFNDNKTQSDRSMIETNKPIEIKYFNLDQNKLFEKYIHKITK